MATDEGLRTRVGLALAVRFGTSRFGPPAPPLDFSARSGSYLLFRVFLAGLSNSRIDWAAWSSPRRRIPAGVGRAVRACGLLVCADNVVVLERFPHGYGNMLGGHDRFAAVGLEFVAAWHAGDLFRVLPFVRQRGAGFFRLSVGWNVAGGGVYCTVFRTGRIPAGVGWRKQAIARELVPAGVGMLPDLFRIGGGKHHGWLPVMAELRAAGRVLPERPAA